MEGTEASANALLQQPWLPVTIDGWNLLVKSCFRGTTYHILLTDLHGVWEETMHSAAIQSRAQELNKRLQASVQAFFTHLCEVVQPSLSGSSQPPEGEAGIVVMQMNEGGLNLRLKSKLEGLPFFWEFRCTPAPITVVCLHLVQPLLSMSQLLHQQVDQLEDLLLRKDVEIQDYKENGATLSRARLQTDIFERQTFKGDFLAKTLPALCCELRGVRDFGGDLRELYSAVAAHRNSRKRKLAEQEHLVATGPDPAISSGAEEKDVTEQNHSSPAEEAGNQVVQTSTAQQQLVTCRRAERASTKAKKKKAVGLFK